MTDNEQRTAASTTALPLRLWLPILIVVVSFLGLLASSLAVNAVMRQVLYSQVDQDLQSAVNGWALNEAIFGKDTTLHPPSEFAIISYSPDADIKFFNTDITSLPNVADLRVGAPPRTVDIFSGDSPFNKEPGKWRALATRSGKSIVVVAKQIRRENDILHGLALMQILISAGVLCVVALLGSGVVHRSLRPLRVVEKTAGQIAAGDLTRRVPSWPDNTEVGQLSKALNSMLGQIQDSVESAQAKELQMRRFVGDASHELRTPLTSVRGYSELYRSGATQDADYVLGKIEDESKRMFLLVEDLLALTRAEGSRLVLRAVDILELSLAVCSSARAAFPGRVVELKNQATSIPHIQGDPDRLHQVLMNLVTNGLRHGGEQAQVLLEIRTDDHHVYIDVQDNGRGMNEEDAAHIFERFYRADSSRTRDTGGSGLGLAITKSLVEQHNGTIAVSSREGQGTTFTVTLPAVSK